MKGQSSKLKGAKQFNPDLYQLLKESNDLKRALKTAQVQRKTLKSHGVLCQTWSVKYAFIDHHKTQFSIITMCRIFDIKPSGYYNWIKCDISAQKASTSQSLQTAFKSRA